MQVFEPLASSDAAFLDLASAQVLSAIAIDLGIGCFLQSVYKDVSEGQLCLDNVYQHENGYLKLELWRSQKSGARVRLNIWQSGLRNSDNVHNHKWDYASYVICGAFKEEMYAPSSEGQVYQHLLYSSRLKGESYTLSRLGRDRLRQYASYGWKAGDIYHRQSVLLHRIVPDQSQLTASLQITYRTNLEHVSDVYGSGKMSATVETVVSPTLQRDEVLAALDAVLSASMTK